MRFGELVQIDSNFRTILLQGILGDIHRDGACAPVAALNLGRDRGRRLPIHIRDTHRGAIPCQPQAYSTPNALPTASHYRYTSFESHRYEQVALAACE